MVGKNGKLNETIEVSALWSTWVTRTYNEQRDREEYSLSSAQQIHAKKGSKHRTCGRVLYRTSALRSNGVVKDCVVVCPLPMLSFTAFKSIFLLIYQ